MNKHLILAALAGVTLAACSSDDEVQVTEFTDPVEVQFAGELVSDPVQSSVRTRSEESWGSGKYGSIGITPVEVTGTSTSNSISKYYNVKYITHADDTYASFTPEGSAIYFQSLKETVKFAAYSPYQPDLTSSEISLSANEENDYSVTDYIWAKSDEANYTNKTVNFAFSHVQSKLIIKVSLDESVSHPSGSKETTIKSVRISGIKTDGTFNIVTGESTADGDATDIVYTSEEGVPSVDLEYIVIPQTTDAFAITVTTSDNDVYKKTFDGGAYFNPGYAYTYTVWARKSGLEIRSATITAWTEAGDNYGEADMYDETSESSMIGDFNDPAQAQRNDLVFSDGSFMHVTNVYDISLTDEQRENLCGFVYYLYENDAVQDVALMSDYPNCRHGLIIAAKNAENCMWQESTSAYVYSMFKSCKVYIHDSGLDGTYDGDYLYGPGNASVKCGYNNTKALQAYNEFLKMDLCRVLEAELDLTVSRVLPCESLSTFVANNPAPANTSGWYIPSVGDLTAMWPDTAYDLYVIIQYLGWDVCYPFSGEYWTSTENNESQAYMVISEITDMNSMDVRSYTYEKTYNLHLRPVCAF